MSKENWIQRPIEKPQQSRVVRKQECEKKHIRQDGKK
jgi:hypothetical protein